MPKRFTQVYDAESLSEEKRAEVEAYLNLIGKKRHTLVSDIASEKESATGASLYYSFARKVIEALGGGEYDANPMMDLPPAQRAQLMQRALTQLSQLMAKTLPPKQESNDNGEGQGGGGGSQMAAPGGGGGRGQGKPQPQKPQPQKLPESGNGKEKPEEKKPAPAAPARPVNEKKPQPPQAQSQSKGQEVLAKTEQETPEEKGDASDWEHLHDIDDADELLDESKTATSHGSGGQQYLVKGDNTAVFYATRDLLNKIARDTDWSEKLPDGSDSWDARRVVKSHFNPTYLRHAKTEYGATTENIYLCLDTSGSVAAMAKDIASMAAGAAGLVHLYHGTEARPHYKVPRNEPLKFPGQPFPEWESKHTEPLLRLRQPDEDGDYIPDPRAKAFNDQFYDAHHGMYPGLPKSDEDSIEQEGMGSFEMEVAWMLEREKVPKGSWLLFWGDTEGPGFRAPQLLKALMRDYRFAWLYPYTRMTAMYKAHFLSSARYDGSDEVTGTIDHDRFAAAQDEYLRGDQRVNSSWVEVFKLEAVGLPVVYEVRGAEGIRRAFQRIQTIK